MEFLSTVLTSLGSVALVGFLFWNLLNAKFSNQEEKIRDVAARVKELENQNREYVLKEDHHNDKISMDRQLKEIRDDIREIPQQITNMLRQFIK